MVLLKGGEKMETVYICGKCLKQFLLDFFDKIIRIQNEGVGDCKVCNCKLADGGLFFLVKKL